MFDDRDFYAKPNTWFEAGTKVDYVCPVLDGYPFPAIMRGIKNGIVDEESCSEHEFEVVYHKDRKLFGRPVRKTTTLGFYPNKLSLDEFIKCISKSLEPFRINMENLKNTKPRYIEDWYELFMAWSEVEQEPNDL